MDYITDSNRSIAILGGLVALIICHALYRRWASVVSNVPGPPSSSWLYGNLPLLLQCEVGEVIQRWRDMYGEVVRVSAPVGQEYLLISDPKTLQYIYHTSGYKYAKHKERNALGQLVVGRGLASVDGTSNMHAIPLSYFLDICHFFFRVSCCLFALFIGDIHKRQRKVMLPAFGATESRALVPIFESAVAKLSTIWKDLITTSDNGSVTVDVPSWLSRATLDALGEAAFDYDFGALENKDDEVSRSYSNLALGILGFPPNNVILFLSLMKYFPESWVRCILTRSNAPRLVLAKENQKLIHDVARKLVDEKYEAVVRGKESRDVMSLIVNANQSENPATRLADDEVISQMQTLMIAGHETTANSLSWTLFELTKHPDIQDKLRAEIREKIAEKGTNVFSGHDYENMPYLTAVLKETLRLWPVAYILYRQAAVDDVLPLSKPITLTNGKVVNELAIPKGQKIIASVLAYNRNEEIFGLEPDVFRPERWFAETKKGVNVGVFSNLMTFGGGFRGCIGWRFALLEMQAFLVELINNFEFTLAVPHEKIFKEPTSVVTPTIAGEREKGVQMPYIIKAVA